MVGIPLGKETDRLRDDTQFVSFHDVAGLIRLHDGTRVVFLERTTQVVPF